MLKHTNSPQSLVPFYEKFPEDLLFFEKEAYAKGHFQVAGVGVDGLGAIAGPLVIAACILPKEGPYIPRKGNQILSNPHIAYAIEVIELLPGQANQSLPLLLDGIKRTIALLSTPPEWILIGGPYNPFSSKNSKTIIQGAKLSHSIAYATSLAKHTRNAIMDGHHAKWPEYDFAKHKGHPTTKHVKNLKQFGPSPIHHGK